METLSTFESRKITTRKSLDTAPDVSAQHVNEAERMDSEGGANHTQGHNKRYDTSRRRSTGSAKADEESFRTNMDKSQSRRNSSDKLSLQTEGLETSNMSEKEIKELALERSREQPLNSGIESGPQPIPGLSYASVVKEATPSQGPVSSVPESILSRQAAKAMQLEKEQRELEKQMELEQVKIQEELLVPASKAQEHLQHPIIPVVLELNQAKTMNIETNELTTNFIHPALEQHIEVITVETVVEAPQTGAKGVAGKLEQGKQQASQKLEQGKQQVSQKLEQGKQLVNEKVDQVKQLASEQVGQVKEIVDGKTAKLQEGAEQVKSNLNSALDNLSSSVSTASPLQKARDILSSVSETVKSKLPSFGSSSEETEEVEEEEVEEEESGPSTLEQLKTQAAQIPTMVSNKVSSMLPISLKNTSTSDINAKANEVASAASDKANELKGKAQSLVAEGQQRLQGAKEDLKAKVPSVEQGKQQLEQGKKQLKQQLQQGKEQLMEKLPAGKQQPKKEEGKQQAAQKLEQGKQQASKKLEQGKQQASKKLEEGKQVANEKVGQVKQLANEKLGQAKQLANEKINQAKELAPELQKKGQQLKEQALEKGEQLKGQANEMLTKKPIEKSTSSSAPSTLNKLLSNITERATDLRNQATETVTNLSNTVSEKLPTNLSASLPDLSNLTEKLPSMASLKGSANETVQQGKKKAKQAKKQLPNNKQQSQLLAQGKQQLSNLSNQAAETLGNLKEQGLSVVQSAGLLDEGNNLQLREGLESSLRKLQGQSQFQSAQSFLAPYIAKGRTMASNYLQSYTDFLYTLKEQNYTMLLVFGLMAVMHVFIPLLFLDYPQARMTIKWFSFVTIFSHAIFYFSHSLKLVQAPNALLYPLITYLLMLSPMMGEGLNQGTSSIFSYLPDWLSWLSVLGIPFQARSYFFTLWLRTLLMLDTAVLTVNFMQAQTFMRKHGGTISTSLKAFFQSDEGKQIKKAGKNATKKLQMAAKPVADIVQNVEEQIAFVMEEDESNEQDEQEMPKQSKKHQLKSKKSTTEIPAKKQRVEESEEEVEQPEENVEESEDVEQPEEEVDEEETEEVEEDVPEESEQEQVEEVEDDGEVEQEESEKSDLPEHEAVESFSKIDDLTVNKLQHMPLDRYASGKGMNKKENGWDFSKENVKEHDELKWDDVQVPFSKQNEDELIEMEDGQLAK